MYEEVRSAAHAALLELLDAAALKPGQQVVIGCSSSEIIVVLTQVYLHPR